MEEKSPQPEKKEAEKKEVTERKDLLSKGEVSLWLDSYDDIFSDFDPRPYSQRALSDDFLNEAKKATRETREGAFTLRFLVPTELRHAQQETTIKKRLRDHFKKHAEHKEQEIKRIRKQGWLLTIAGFLLLMTATTISYYSNDTFLADMFIVFLEPSGWFAAWYGLDRVFYTAKEQEPDVLFYKRMAKAEFAFESI